MIHIIITSYKEPKSTLRCVNSFLNQDIKENLKIIVADPFKEVGEFLKKNIKDKRFSFFLDPGIGKTHAMNQILKDIYSENKNDIIIFSDGDVYVNETSINDILNRFKDEKIGAVTGRPVSTNERNNKYGYWSKVLYAGADKVRKRLDKDNMFFQCSGYLFAIRNGLIKEIPLDVGEDAVIPYFIWKKGYKIGYVSSAEVYIKYPDNWKDWLNQRVRTIKGHENISKLYPDMPRTKSFFNEIKEGALFVLRQPRNLKELIWTFDLYFARLYIYYRSFKELRKSTTAYDPGWREVEISSTKPMD